MRLKLPSIYIGFDTRMPLAYAVTMRSMLDQSRKGLEARIKHLHLQDLQARGIYHRHTLIKNGNLFDDISNAPMATEFAISRFLIPLLEDYKGWSVFCDSDFLFRADINDLLDLADDRYAVQCVKHNYAPAETTKMDGQQQLNYARKNWSSLILFNNEHPSNRELDANLVNFLPGRDLHRFCWLADDEIGELPAEWNWLEGHSSADIEPKAVHFTRGTPDMDGYQNVPYADEWKAIAEDVPLCRLES